ncbi:MAG: hypothetical protein EOM06_12005 [Sphingobacteriia bacterium]|nr:hypothetical protein [Sphingobacteriia bacterium]
MKWFLKTGSFCFMLLICLSGCKNKWSQKNYLGEIPAIAASYREKIEILEHKTDNCYNLEKAFEYAVKAKNLSKEAEQKIGEAFDELPKPVLIPVIQDHHEAGFSIREVSLVAASQQTLLFEITVDTEFSTFLPDTIFICGINKKDQLIKPPVLFGKSKSTIQQDSTIFSGIVLHPENFIHLKSFKIVNRNP